MNEAFELERQENIARLIQARDLQRQSTGWLIDACKYRYSYNFSWMGRPIIQFPQDVMAMQEIIWAMQPDLIVETGIAHGGSLIFYASMLELLGGDRQVLGIDVDIREHNRKDIEQHPMFKRIKLMQGSSIDENLVRNVFEHAKAFKKVLVILDSNHTHEHVLRELELYSPLVKKGGYLVVFDTVVEDMPEDFFKDRPWGKGNNPKTAVWRFLEQNDRFAIDKAIESKLLITVAPDGYLKCVKD